MRREKHSTYWVQCYLQFQASTGGLGTGPPGIRGGDYCKCWSLMNPMMICHCFFSTRTLFSPGLITA